MIGTSDRVTRFKANLVPVGWRVREHLSLPSGLRSLMASKRDLHLRRSGRNLALDSGLAS